MKTLNLCIFCLLLSTSIFGQITEQQRLSIWENERIRNAQIDAQVAKERAEFDAELTRINEVKKLGDEQHSPGHYLRSASSNIVTGTIFGFASGGLLMIANRSLMNDPNFNVKPLRTISGGLLIVGFAFEMAGVVKIGKAGLSLDENGVGITVKF